MILRWGALVFSLISATHAVLHKRDPRAALGWVLLSLWVPWAGAAIYWVFGVNRIRTHAQDLHRKGRWNYLKTQLTPGSVSIPSVEVPAHFKALRQLSTRVTRRPLLSKNQARLLRDGEAAYPAMLAAIDSARTQVYLSSYIFEPDETGLKFVEALSRAHQRGVQTRILVDAFGARYSMPEIFVSLKKAGISFSKFLPFSLSINRFHPNLRNHRKMLLIDNQVGFTGGMNIGDRHLTQKPPLKSRVSDLHFELTGPVVKELRDVFLEDWYFSSGESIAPEPPLERGPLGPLAARVISSGPNEDFEKLNWILLEALSTARETVRVITPYFVPDRVIIAALNGAALRGVAVDIILPEKNNLPFVGWASRAMLWEMLQKGVRFHYQRPPFAHTKLMVVDGYYGLIGSSNWDSRSFRLNFELDVETYGDSFARDLTNYFDEILGRAAAVSLAEVQRDSLPARLRNSFCKLFSPYL